MASRGEKLEQWLLDVRAALTERGVATELAYDDRVGGDVLVLALWPHGEAGDQPVWLTTTRRTGGKLHLTAMAASQAGARAAADVTARMHREIPRMSNQRRRFVHRIARMLDELARTWTERAATPPALDAAIARLRELAPDARAVLGVGFHTTLAGADDHHTREVYPTLYGAAFPTEGGWRALPWDAAAGAWSVSTATASALQGTVPGVDLALGGIVVTPVLAAALTGAALGAGAMAVAANASTGNSRSRDSTWCNAADCALTPCDLADLVPDCDVVDCGSLDLGDCTPDCNL